MAKTARRFTAFLLALAAGGCGAVTSGRGDGGTDAGSSAEASADARSDAAVGSCALPNGGTCAEGQRCPAGDGCNTCSCAGGLAACTELACPMRVDAGPEAASRSCATSADCSSAQACHYPADRCAAAGLCEDRLFCGLAPTYCGCDGQTYSPSSDCAPDRPTQHTGACVAASCRSTAECARGQECVFPLGSCGVVGQCQAQRECDAPVPFCGCDGVTFANCPGAPSRPNVGEGTCPVGCTGPCALGAASLGPDGASCLGATDGACPVTCCRGWNCDLRTAHCRSLPPMCAAGSYPTVGTTSCWGPCVPGGVCAPFACDTMGTCPAGFACTAGGTCAAR